MVRDACSALEVSAGVFVAGHRGSGLTTFGTKVLGLRRGGQRAVHRITGSPALTSIPFASVAALGAQVPALRDLSHSPVEMMSRIAELAPSGQRTLFLDRAEHIDPASAAALVQLAELGVCELIVGYSEPTALPEDLQRLTFEHGSALISLPELTLADTLVILKDLMGSPFDMSSAQRLLDLAGGNPLLVRELALDAQSTDAIGRHRGYLSISASWRAKSSRVSQLLRNRLSGQPEMLREAVELAAVLGELPREIAARVLSPDQIERALEARLLSSVPTGESGPAKLVLGAGLSPETVVAILGATTLAATIEKLREHVPENLLTPNMRVQLATHSRSVGIEETPEQLVADAKAAAQSRQFDAVIALTARLGNDAEVGAARSSLSGADSGLAADAADAADAAEGELRMFRSEAFLETGDPETALRVLEPLLAAGNQDARLFASFVEFSGLGRPDLMQRRLAAGSGSAPEASVPLEDAALRAILTARAGEEVPLATLRSHAADERLTLSLRLSIAAQIVSELSYLGSPGDALTEYTRLRASELWHESPPSQRGELMHTLLVAMQSHGDAEHSYLPLFTGINWDELALDHAMFLAATSMQRIERGDASGAVELLTQAAALVEHRDPHLLAGFIAALDAVASVMLGDRDRARESYAQFSAGSVTSGQVARQEAIRLSLAVVQALEGSAAATAALADLLAEADRRGHRLVRMRLLHEGWRLRLAVSADELSAAASNVQGPYAATLGRYTAAFGDAAEQAPELRRSALDTIIAEHLASGRLLYAAEAAARGAEDAKARGERKRASALLDACAEAAAPLDGVHTPSLRRVRIDAELLSEREYEVCLRAAAGLSNAEIADEHFVSPRTVEGHLQRAYSKLGVADRRMLLLPL